MSETPRKSVRILTQAGWFARAKRERSSHGGAGVSICPGAITSVRIVLRLVGYVATACFVAIWATSAAAQLAPLAPEPPGFRAKLAQAAAHLDRGDLRPAEALYGAVYAEFPSAEVMWGLGRLACARSNLGDCRAWLTHALASSICPLTDVQRAEATRLLQSAQQNLEQPVRPTVVVLSPAEAASLERRFEPGPLSGPVDRATLWTAVSVVVVSVLAGTLVAISASGQ